MCDCPSTAGWHRLPAWAPSLGLGTPVLCGGEPGPPGTVHLLGPQGGIAVPPDAATTIRFGRWFDGRGDATVVVGASDLSVSRHHGTLEYTGRWWRLRCDGLLPVRSPELGEPLLTSHEATLPAGFSTLYIDAPRRTHVLEALVTPSGPPPTDPSSREAPTGRPPSWELSDTERLVLTVLFAPFLRRDDEPRPEVTAEVAETLTEVTGRAWTPRQVGGVVDGVRVRLAGRGAPRLLADQTPPEQLRYRLYQALAVTTRTLTPRDLDLLHPHGGTAR